MSDLVEVAKSYSGVQYAVEWDGKIRVVFKHKADPAVIEEMNEVFAGREGRLNATQEHLPCVDYHE